MRVRKKGRARAADRTAVARSLERRFPWIRSFGAVRAARCVSSVLFLWLSVGFPPVFSPAAHELRPADRPASERRDRGALWRKILSGSADVTMLGRMSGAGR
ncbi:hypothetical protein AOLI_G00015570 [Acnodon oligacanthus]